eukprot:2975738-Rhodomonas_salina.2
MQCPVLTYAVAMQCPVLQYAVAVQYPVLASGYAPSDVGGAATGTDVGYAPTRPPEQQLSTDLPSARCGRDPGSGRELGIATYLRSYAVATRCLEFATVISGGTGVSGLGASLAMGRQVSQPWTLSPRPQTPDPRPQTPDPRQTQDPGP